MTNNKENSEPKKPFIAKKPSPFNVDPYNNRGGKSGTRSGVVGGGNQKAKSITVSKFKGGSGGDR